MAWLLKSLLRPALSVLLFELVEHVFAPILARVVWEAAVA
jgi:hypothetical protein